MVHVKQTRFKYGENLLFLIHKISKKDDLSSLLSKLQIDNKEIMIKNSIKFLEVILDERLN